jgi:hypothetical protein
LPPSLWTRAFLFASLGVFRKAGRSNVGNEGNFDIDLLPMSLDDLFSGPAFRGAGQELRSEVVSVPAGF